MSATDLWAAVVASYDSNGLLRLTNIESNEATAIDTTVGEDAAQTVINLWPIYAEEDYDATDATHVEVAKMGVIAVLWRRGGTSADIERVKWDEVFSPEGLIARVRRTGARGRTAPQTNSGVSQKSELQNGRAVRGWSDDESLPEGILPRKTVAED